jgi:hypothetical protein
MYGQYRQAAAPVQDHATCASYRLCGSTAHMHTGAPGFVQLFYATSNTCCVMQGLHSRVPFANSNESRQNGVKATMGVSHEHTRNGVVKVAAQTISSHPHVP